MSDQQSASDPMPFAIDLLAGVELLLALGAFAFLGLAELASRVESPSLPPIGNVYAIAFREAAPTALALLAGPPVLVAIGLFRRRAWGRWGSIGLHVALGACALWHFVERASGSLDRIHGKAEVTIVMAFLFVLAFGVPLFLRRPHMRAAFARGTR